MCDSDNAKEFRFCECWLTIKRYILGYGSCYNVLGDSATGFWREELFRRELETARQSFGAGSCDGVFSDSATDFWR